MSALRIVKRFLLASLLVSSLALAIAFVRLGGNLTVRASSIAYQGDLVLTGNNVTVIQGQFDIKGSIIVENNATLILRDAAVNFMEISDYQYNMTFQNPTDGNPRLIVENATIMTPYSFSIYSFGNSSCVADDLYVWPAYATGIWWYLYDSSSMSIANSTVYTVTAYGNAFFEAKDCYMRYLSAFNSVSADASSTYVESLTSFDSANVTMSDSTIYNIYTRYGSFVKLVNSTSSTFDFYDTGGVTVNWYLDVKVVDSYGVPIGFVNVTAHDSNFALVESKLADANGRARLTLMEKRMNATGSYPAGNYIVGAQHLNGAAAGEAINIAGNQAVTISLPFNIEDFIVINPDGSITPLSANITSSDKVTYSFTGNNYAPLIVDRNSIIINGMGYTLQAPGYSALSLIGMFNVTIENATIANSGGGISLHSCSNCTVSGNNIIGNNYAGVSLGSSFNCTVSGNNVTDNFYGVSLDTSSDNVLSGNVIANSTSSNFGVSGYEFSHFVNYVETSNLVNNRPIYYLMNQSNIVVSPQTHPQGIGYLGLINCKNVTVQDMIVKGNGQGMLLAYTNDSAIIHNNFTENADGVYLYSSYDIVVSGNNITGSYYDEGGSGVAIFYSNCTLSENSITENYYGAEIYSSTGCIVSGNSITNNLDYGVVISDSTGNTFYHNNFLNNTQHAHSTGSLNTWDNGYPSGGNYWSDYNGTDADHDGIGDTPYVIDPNNTDNYPLMTTFIIPEFPSFLILTLFMLAALLSIIVYRKKQGL